MPDIIVQSVDQLIEEKGVAAGNVTHSFLKTTIAEIIKETQAIKRNNPVPPTSQPSKFALLSWGDRFRRLPIDFVFPSVDTSTAWQLWWRGNFFFFQAEDGIRDGRVTGVQTCALPI